MRPKFVAAIKIVPGAKVRPAGRARQPVHKHLHTYFALKFAGRFST
jgi:hypothetical protein